jgi:alkanesulfonate monooxygenase SsuD/methylene tetrahydromethanopterin reductase-like flavin-dependent oxidoreductase (luciferase family)
MEVGIGLPNAVPGVNREAIVDWARRAEAAGFSALGTIDRIVYLNYEPLLALAAAAAVTDRIRLMTDILIAPLRPNTALLAKQTATIDHMSGGRLVLGLAVGGREDDFEASGVAFHRRGALFDAQLDELKRTWAGEKRGFAGAVGPPPARPGGPELLIGGRADVVFQRAARHARGWTQGGGTPDALRESLVKLKQAWQEAGREDQPYSVALFYFALGDDAREKAQRGVGDYYAFLGDYRDSVVQSVATSPEMVSQYLSAFRDAGADEVICFPSSTDLDDVERLAEAAL